MDNNLNSGNLNSGNWNSGNWNSGNLNSGDWNSGDRNSGNRNSGDWNSGNWNSGDWNSGFFNTETHRFMFDRPVTEKEIENITWPNWIYFGLCDWIETSQMSDKEKDDNPSHKTTGGFLRAKSYQDAAREAFNAATDQDRELTTKLPNFDNEKFEKIFGFRCEPKTPSLSGQKVTVTVGDKTYTATID